jgi:CRP-like cAMP-binding protein
MPENEIRSGTNLLLNALSPESRELLLSRSKTIALPLRSTLQRQDEPPQYAYFLLSGVASVVATLENGESVEVMMIGREGVVDGLDLIGPAVSHTDCFIQSDAAAIRIPVSDLRRAFRESEEIRDRILEFVQAQAFSQRQIAACHRLHNAEERLARWLLTVRDRIDSDLLVLTQEFLAQMLGSRRSTVNIVAGTLHRSGLIEYSRGRVHILDADRLESVACNCYHIIKNLSRNLYSDAVLRGATHSGFPTDGKRSHSS